MELIVIGCWSPFPKTGEACSGYLIKHKNTSILLDCGHSVFSHLGKYHDFSYLDAIFVSHFHPDHYVDLYAFRHAIRGLIYAGKRNNPLKVYLPGEPFNEFNYWSKLPELEVIQVREGIDYQVEEIKMSFLKMRHSMTGYAVKVTAGNSSLFYTGDTALTENLKAADNVDLLLAEATLVDAETEYARESGHMTCSDLGLLACNTSPGLLVATHFWPGYSREQIIKEIGSIYKNEFLLAHCGLKLYF